MDWLIEPFELAFQQRALSAGVIASVCLAVVGTWVVVRGLTFLGDALVHGVIPGIALAVLLDFNLVIGAATAAVIMILGVGVVHRQTGFSEDTGVGLLFVGMLSLGVIIMSGSASYAGSLTGILFGDVLGVTDQGLLLLAGVALVAVTVTLLMHRRFLVLSFNEQKARLLGMGPVAAHLAMLGVITLAIVGSFQTVGTLLVFGLLVGPPATAALLTRRVPMIMLAATGIGALSVVIGLIVSYHLGTAGSATMSLVPVVLFFLVLAVRSLVPDRLKPRAA